MLFTRNTARGTSFIFKKVLKRKLYWKMLYVKNISTTKNDPIFFSLGSDNLLLYREAFVNNFSHGRVPLQ